MLEEHPKIECVPATRKPPPVVLLVWNADSTKCTARVYVGSDLYWVESTDHEKAFRALCFRISHELEMLAQTMLFRSQFWRPKAVDVSV